MQHSAVGRSFVAQRKHVFLISSLVITDAAALSRGTNADVSSIRAPGPPAPACRDCRRSVGCSNVNTSLLKSLADEDKSIISSTFEAAAAYCTCVNQDLIQVCVVRPSAGLQRSQRLANSCPVNARPQRARPKASLSESTLLTRAPRLTSPGTLCWNSRRGGGAQMILG